MELAPGVGKPVRLSELDRLTRQANQLASRIDQFHKATLFLLIGVVQTPRFKALSQTLRDYAMALRGYRGFAKRTRRSWASILRAQLTAYVRHATGQHHDKEVADLIACACQVSQTEQDQRMWRQRHPDVIKQATAFLAANQRRR